MGTTALFLDSKCEQTKMNGLNMLATSLAIAPTFTPLISVRPKVFQHAQLTEVFCCHTLNSGPGIIRPPRWTIYALHGEHPLASAALYSFLRWSDGLPCEVNLQEQRLGGYSVVEVIAYGKVDDSLLVSEHRDWRAPATLYFVVRQDQSGFEQVPYLQGSKRMQGLRLKASSIWKCSEHNNMWEVNFLG